MSCLPAIQHTSLEYGSFYNGSNYFFTLGNAMEYTRFMFLAVYSGRAIMYDKRYKIYTYHFLLYLLHPQIQISNGHLNYSSDVPELSNLENILFVCICYSSLIIEAGKIIPPPVHI